VKDARIIPRVLYQKLHEIWPRNTRKSRQMPFKIAEVETDIQKQISRMKDSIATHCNIKSALIDHRNILSISMNRVYLHSTIYINSEKAHFA